LAGEIELGGEHFALELYVVAFDPTVEAAFTDTGMGNGVEVRGELLLPVWAGSFPRVKAKGRDDEFRIELC